MYNKYKQNQKENALEKIIINFSAIVLSLLMLSVLLGR